MILRSLARHDTGDSVGSRKRKRILRERPPLLSLARDSIETSGRAIVRATSDKVVAIAIGTKEARARGGVRQKRADAARAYRFTRENRKVPVSPDENGNGVAVGLGSARLGAEFTTAWRDGAKMKMCKNSHGLLCPVRVGFPSARSLIFTTTDNGKLPFASAGSLYTHTRAHIHIYREPQGQINR